MNRAQTSEDQDVKQLKLHRVLKSLIAERNVSAREVSRATKIPQSTLTSFLSGRGSHKPEQVLSLARFFGVSMEFLLFGEDEREPTLAEVLTEGMYEGWLKVRIERAIPTKRKVKVSDEN